MNKGTVIIASSILDAWGGSEELWAKTVPFIQSAGYQVVVCKNQIHHNHKRIAGLKENGVTFLPTAPAKPFLVRLYWKIVNKIRFWIGIKGDPDKPYFYYWYDSLTFKKYLKKYKPKMVLVSQGVNFDGLHYAHACMDCKVPYALVSHKAVDFYWPQHFDHRESIRSIFKNARHCFFVSEHTKRLTEEQYGLRLPGSRVILNPIKNTEYIPFPSTEEGFQLCCIGRIFIVEKGQDMLIRVLSQPKWKSRPVVVNFIGTGPDEVVLKELAELLGVNNISFHGHVDDVYELWGKSHALVLPSRTEGLPLVIVEAMMAGRPVITTDVGGNKEFLEEGETAFIGHANDQSFEEAMERAWQRRQCWAEMGEKASRSIRSRIHESPEKTFANQLLSAL